MSDRRCDECIHWVTPKTYTPCQHCLDTGERPDWRPNGKHALRIRAEQAEARAAELERVQAGPYSALVNRLMGLSHDLGAEEDRALCEEAARSLHALEREREGWREVIAEDTETGRLEAIIARCGRLIGEADAAHERNGVMKGYVDDAYAALEYIRSQGVYVALMWGAGNVTVTKPVLSDDVRQDRSRYFEALSAATGRELHPPDLPQLFNIPPMDITGGMDPADWVDGCRAGTAGPAAEREGKQE